QKKSRKTGFPREFIVSGDMDAWYHRQPGFVLPIRQATEAWVDAMIANGNAYQNWEAAWRTGMRNQNKWENERRKRNGQLTPGEIAANNIADCLGEDRPF
ncbi:hypothetical protein, partial [Kistimonas scapharcae]|uniref:hypothetical protein n=1 Tax=Kistimonas scapharcae TaxID=1036133 RepID=UPI0031EEE612